MSDRDEGLDLEELSLGDQPVAIPGELPILPLRDTVLFPNSFMPLAVARESSVRLIDEAISARQADRRLYPARRVGRGAAAGRSVQRRHRQPHPQDVQAAGRQPAADRPGTGAADARRGDRDASLSAGARDAGGRSRQRRGPSRDRRAAAQHQDELPAGRVAVAAAVRRSADAGVQHHRAGPAGRFHRLEPDDHRHAPSSRRCSRRSTCARGWTA